MWLASERVGRELTEAFVKKILGEEGMGERLIEGEHRVGFGGGKRDGRDELRAEGIIFWDTAADRGRVAAT